METKNLSKFELQLVKHYLNQLLEAKQILIKDNFMVTQELDVDVNILKELIKHLN